MTSPPSTPMPNAPAATPSFSLRNYLPWIFAAGILIAYFFLVKYMLNNVTLDEKVWVKLTYVFGSVEAIVFAAVGFIFGREVNRSRAVIAESKAKKATNDKKKLAKEVIKSVPGKDGGGVKLESASTDYSHLVQMAEDCFFE